MAGIEGCDEQAKVREDWREEAEHADQGVGRWISWFVRLPHPIHVAPTSLLLTYAYSSSFLHAEFAIYLNYVRKLGFEETPDYDFLRELFTKVLKNSGEPEDGVYDWMMLNGGKGWEAGPVRRHFQPLFDMDRFY